MVQSPPSEQTEQFSVFRRSLPVVFTSFVNKCGDMGMRVFPMLLVERGFSTAQSSFAMGAVKSAAIVAAFMGGTLGDRFGTRTVLLLSFGLSGIGTFFLPFSQTIWLVGALGVIATFGQGLFAAPLRIMVIKTVGVEHRKEALAWLRTGQNTAVMLANAIALFASGFGLAPLYFFDAATSAVAVFAGKKLLPRIKLADEDVVPPAPQPGSSSGLSRSAILDIALVTALNAGFNVLMELFFVTASAAARMQFGAKGVEVFSQVMIVNTFMCAVFNVWLARVFKSVGLACGIGVVAQFAAWVIVSAHSDTSNLYFWAVFVQTIGELALTSLASFILLKVIPDRGHQGKIYGIALVFQLGGRALGAALAFPLIDHPEFGYWGGGALTLVLTGVAVVIGRRVKG